MTIRNTDPHTAPIATSGEYNNSSIPMCEGYSDAKFALLSYGFAYIPGEFFEEPFHMANAVEEIIGKGTLIGYEEDKISPRSRLGNSVYTSTDFNAIADIYVHNECCTKPEWPLYVAFYCKLPASKGGRTTISSIRDVTKRIPKEIQNKFKEYGIRYTRNIGGNIGNSILYTFGTTDKTLVNSYCRNAGMAVEWRSNDQLRLTFNRAPLVPHPRTGESLWFNDAVFWNPHSLDRLLRMGVRNVPESDLAFNSALGNGTPIPKDWVDAMKSAYETAMVPFEWSEGGLLILDNMLYAHGREKFQGEREVWVTMAQAVRRPSPPPSGDAPNLRSREI